MRKISDKLVAIFSILWLVYFIYSLILTFYDITTIRKVDWTNAKNISSTYSGYKATIVTYKFQKNNIQIARQYAYFTQGLTVWSWGIDKKADYVNLSFFVKKKDYEKVVNDSPPYYKLWFSNRKEVDTIPFFGLRKINQSPNKILLFFDILKYNYSNSIGFIIYLFMPIFIVLIAKKITKNKDFKLEDIPNLSENNYLSKIAFLFMVIVLLRFLI